MKTDPSTNGKTRKPGEKPGPEWQDTEVGTLVPQTHGGALRHGSKPGTNKGGPGRPPDQFKRVLRKLVSRPQTLAYLKECLNGDHGPAPYMAALHYASDRGFGKVPTVSQVSGGGEPLEIILTRG